MFKNSPSIVFAIDDVIVTSVNTYTSMMGIGTEDKYLIKSLQENTKHGAKRLLKMFPNKNWSLGGLKVLMKKLTTQVGLLCGQCEVDHYPIHRTTVPVFSIFFDQRFQSTKTAVFVRKHFEQLLCSKFLISRKHFIK